MIFLFRLFFLTTLVFLAMIAGLGVIVWLGVRRLFGNSAVQGPFVHDQFRQATPEQPPGDVIEGEYTVIEDK